MTPVSTQVPPTKVWTSNFFTFPLCRLFAFSAAILWANVATGAVFHSRSEIADLAVPDCDRVETRDIFLSPEQR
ncbi:MAG TPA: hypothetical protein VFO62_04730, partial [Candidatus Binatia bacterium]|nr:hypothetical protein [Candidatus Binatia bacterium]